jgi:hypothetical protein
MQRTIDPHEDWQQCNSETFWREVAVCSHVVQLYENDQALLNLLEDFVVGGILANDSVIIIATKKHLSDLAYRMSEHGLNVEQLCTNKQYIPLNAEEVLAQFMVNDLPDSSLFVNTISGVFDSIRKDERQVRAFGEMVALLWAQGNTEATIQLEHLWNDFFNKESFSLFCAYPKAIFSEDSSVHLSNICQAHSKLIKNTGEARFDVSYLDMH